MSSSNPQIPGYTPRRLPYALQAFKRPIDYLSRGLIAASYPLRGMVYFLRRPAFYPVFLSRLLPLSILSCLVYLILFTFTFLPQYAFLAIFHGWGAWVNAVILVLGEGLVIIQGLFEGFFVDECRVDVFDATLINEGLVDMLSPHRILFVDAPNSVKKLGKPTSPTTYQPWSLVQIIELIVFLPLNLIPYVGVPAFIIITGARLGTFAHYRWFQLRGLTKAERKHEIRDRVWDYAWFGTVAMILELIPILSFFFLLSTTAGSALWAAKLEKQSRLPQPEEHAGAPAPADADQESGVEDAHDADAAPPPYSDHAV